MQMRHTILLLFFFRFLISFTTILTEISCYESFDAIQVTKLFEYSWKNIFFFAKIQLLLILNSVGYVPSFFVKYSTSFNHKSKETFLFIFIMITDEMHVCYCMIVCSNLMSISSTFFSISLFDNAIAIH